MTVELLPAVRRRLDAPAGFVLGERTDVPAVDGERLPVEDPSTGTVLGQVAAGGAADVDRAVALARQAVADRRWSAKHPGKQSLVLQGIRRLMEENEDELAQWQALDAGVPIGQAPLEVIAGSAVVHHYSGWAAKVYGDLNPVVENFHSYTVREPVGVVAVLLPGVQPLVTAALRIAPALAAGNCAVPLPSRRAPYTALRIGELALEAGLPPGVPTVLTGEGAAAGSALAAHPGVDMVTCLGSERTGARVRQEAAATPKRILMELGGRNPNIVFPDADLDQAAATAALALWRHAGQPAAAGTRLLVHRSVHDEVVERVVEEVRTHPVGPATSPSTHIGPLLSAGRRDRLVGLVRAAESQGAKPALRASRPALPGYFITPAVLTGVAAGSPVAQEEVAGPVLAVTAFDDDAEAVHLANGTRFGLGAALWTSDLRRAHRLTQHLRAGTVWVNTYGLQDPSAPLGGRGASGSGRDGGREWIRTYTETKTVFVSLL